MRRIDFDRFPDDAYIEDGLLILGDEAWTPMDVTMEIRSRREYSTKYTAIQVRRWRERNPEKVRALNARAAAKRRTGRPVGRPRKAA